MTPEIVHDFIRRVDKSGDCWIWMGVRDSSGYGKFSYHGKYLRAHRFSWELVNGPIPYGKLIRHACDNPVCVNPSHLLLGTFKENSDDKEVRDRGNHPTGKDHGRAKLNEDAVKEARDLFREGVRISHLASKFRVDNATMLDAVVGKTWKHVPDPCANRVMVDSLILGLGC
jgi:hypothetical protein